MALIAWGCQPTQTDPRALEVCGNGVDDNDNGFADCDDAACAQEPECAGGAYGLCEKCGNPCGSQSECLQYDYFTDEPVPMCLDGKCNARFESVDIRFELDTASYAGVSAPIRTMAVRFISKKEVNGGPVTCATVSAVASSNSKPLQLEDTKRFNLLAFDTAPVSQAVGVPITQPYLSTNTGKDFLIWIELWSGERAERLPTGLRVGWGCVEDGPAVEEILPSHHWPSGEPEYPTSRTIQVTMPPPQ